MRSLGVKIVSVVDGEWLSSSYNLLPEEFHVRYAMQERSVAPVGKLFVHNPLKTPWSIGSDQVALLSIVEIEPLINENFGAPLWRANVAYHIRNFWNTENPCYPTTSSYYWHATSVTPIFDITEDVQYVERRVPYGIQVYSNEYRGIMSWRGCPHTVEMMELMNEFHHENWSTD